MAKNGGFSLPEMLLIVVILGILGAIATPRFRDAVVHSQVRGARYAVSSAYQMARISAIQSHQPTTLYWDADSAWIIRRVGGVAQAVGVTKKLSSEYGVAVGTTDSIRFYATGLPLMNGRKAIVVTRGGVSDSLSVSKYGSVQ